MHSCSNELIYKNDTRQSSDHRHPQYNLSVESNQNVESKRQNVESKMEKNEESNFVKIWNYWRILRKICL